VSTQPFRYPIWHKSWSKRSQVWHRVWGRILETAGKTKKVSSAKSQRIGKDSKRIARVVHGQLTLNFFFQFFFQFEISTKITVEAAHGLISQVLKHLVFNQTRHETHP
jgi:hypothetical protein